MGGKIFVILVILPRGFCPLVIVGIMLLKGKFRGEGVIGIDIAAMLAILWILYGVSFVVFMVLGVLYYLLGGGV